MTHLYHAIKVIRHPLQCLTPKNDAVLWIQVQTYRSATPQILTCNVWKGKRVTKITVVGLVSLLTLKSVPKPIYFDYNRNLDFPFYNSHFETLPIFKGSSNNSNVGGNINVSNDGIGNQISTETKNSSTNNLLNILNN